MSSYIFKFPLCQWNYPWNCVLSLNLSLSLSVVCCDFVFVWFFSCVRLFEGCHVCCIKTHMECAHIFTDHIVVVSLGFGLHVVNVCCLNGDLWLHPFSFFFLFLFLTKITRTHTLFWRFNIFWLSFYIFSLAAYIF